MKKSIALLLFSLFAVVANTHANDHKTIERIVNKSGSVVRLLITYSCHLAPEEITHQSFPLDIAPYQIVTTPVILVRSECGYPTVDFTVQGMLEKGKSFHGADFADQAFVVIDEHRNISVTPQKKNIIPESLPSLLDLDEYFKWIAAQEQLRGAVQK